jgi:hypothetical protein
MCVLSLWLSQDNADATETPRPHAPNEVEASRALNEEHFAERTEKKIHNKLF